MSATHHDSSDGKDTGDDEGIYTGFNAMFADGSVKMINYDIDLDVHDALGSRNGGEVIDKTAF